MKKLLLTLFAALCCMTNIYAADPDLASDYTLVRSASFGSGATLAGTETCAYKAWNGSYGYQDLTVLTAPEDAAGWIALQSSNWNGMGWMDRSSKGLWCRKNQRAGAVFGDDLATGWLVVFECSQTASNVLTLTNGTGDPDGTFTYAASEDGNTYYCTITAATDAYVGFCGIGQQGYITSISVYKPKGETPAVEGNLQVCGTQVTSENADDVLGDGAFSYDASTKTLHVKGDCDYDGNYMIMNMDIEGLTVAIDQDVTLRCTTNPDFALWLWQSTTITGPGKLTLYGNISLINGVGRVLTFDGADVDLQLCTSKSIMGNQGGEALVVKNSTIHAEAYYWAICDFTGGITLEDSTVGDGLRLSDDGSAIVTASSSEATEAVITAKADGIGAITHKGTTEIRKVLVDGQVLIVQPDGRIYNLTGTEVR